MNTKGIVGLSLFLLTAGILPVRSASTLTEVSSVDSASITIGTAAPQWAQINASGKVGQGGWTEAQLIKLIPISPPHSPPTDGIYSFKFMAVPPNSMTTQVLTPITAKTYRWRYPLHMQGVRIYAASNCIIALLPQVDKTKIDGGKCTVTQ